MSNFEKSSPVFCCQKAICTRTVQSKPEDRPGPHSYNNIDHEIVQTLPAQREDVNNDRLMALQTIQSFTTEAMATDHSDALTPLEVIDIMTHDRIFEHACYFISVRTRSTTKRLSSITREHRWFMRGLRNNKPEWMELPLSYVSIHRGNRFNRIEGLENIYECENHATKTLVHFWVDKEKLFETRAWQPSGFGQPGRLEDVPLINW